jgi:hypothetical protein
MGKFSFVFERNGLRYAGQVISAYFIEPAIMRILPFYLRLYQKMKAFRESRTLDRELGYWRTHRAELLKPAEQGYRLRVEDLGLTDENLDCLKKQVGSQAGEVVVADIDQDGFLLSYFGPIKHKPTVPAEQFLTRKRFPVALVAVNGYVGVKKNYKGQRYRFFNELRALYYLASSGCNVPAILDVDFDNLTLTFSYIPGKVLSQELAKKGAVLQQRDVSHQDYAHRSRKERRPIRIQEAKKVLPEVVDADLVERIFVELSKIHAAGVIGNDIKYGNVIIEQHSGQPYWIDFEHAPYYPNLGRRLSQLLRDRDIENFNLFFDTKKLTYQELTARISRKEVPAPESWTAPVYFGSGLRLGSLWNVEAGYGCWHYFLKHHLPPLADKRILLVGGGNGFEAMQMLRLGANQVIGLEGSSQRINQGHFVKAAFEWADNTTYPFRYLQASLTDLPTLNLGCFDLIVVLLAGCELAQDLKEALLPGLSRTGNTLIWQIEAKPGGPISMEEAQRALQASGFRTTRVIAPHRYSRALVIAAKEENVLYEVR